MDSIEITKEDGHRVPVFDVRPVMDMPQWRFDKLARRANRGYALKRYVGLDTKDLSVIEALHRLDSELIDAPDTEMLFVEEHGVSIMRRRK